MPHPKVDDATFIRLFRTFGAAGVQKQIGGNLRSIYARRRNVEKNNGTQIKSPNHNGQPVTDIEYPHRAEFAIQNGVVLVGSDAHIWPGQSSPALRGFRFFAKELKPKIIVLNGDVLDFPQISRHDPIGWEGWPSVKAELEAAQEELHELALAAPRGCEKVWTLGNHDARFESRLANAAPEFARVQGVHLRDHFPVWRPAWAAWVNNEVVIKHRFKGGVHATHNNAVGSGKTMVTGHLHSAKVTPYTDYNGTRYGVDTGCLADPDAKAFINYTEDNPKNWRAAFGVLTFKGGKLLPPELAQVWDAKTITFRGDLIRV
jgi:UDP-2,3-diacylglucosamine pyrophosphatase LpxH